MIHFDTNIDSLQFDFRPMKLQKGLSNRLKWRLLQKLNKIPLFRLFHNVLHDAYLLKDRYNCPFNDVKAYDTYRKIRNELCQHNMRQRRTKNPYWLCANCDQYISKKRELLTNEEYYKLVVNYDN